MQNDTHKRLEVENIDKETLFDTISKIVEKTVKTELQKLTPNNRILTRKQLADILQVTENTLWNWEKAKILKSSKFANRVYYLESDVLEMLKNKQKNIKPE